jgi:uncharacterized protein (TIGR02217 family)
MSSPIVTLPANVSSGLPYFPADQFAGLQLDVKRNIAFDNTLSRAASGRETGVSWRELPVTTFELDWAFLDANMATTPPSQDGSPVYPEFDKLLGFFSQQHGDLMPFYLKLSTLTLNPADSQVYGQQLAIGDGSTINFQLCRTVGPYLEIVQTPDPAATPVIYVDGALVSTWTLLPGGIIQFASAPALNAVISADFNWVYLCRFDAPDTDIDQFAYLVHECKTLKLRTVIQ